MSETYINSGLDIKPRKFTITHTQLQTGALTNDIELFSLPAGGIITMVKVKHSTGFAGTGITSYKVSVGISGNLTKYHPQYEVETTANPVSNTTFNVNNTLGSEDHGSATSIRIAATSVGGNLNASTAGSVDVWVWMTKAV